ncbi:DUF2856 family protein, partial [Shigella dysenteriae]
MPAPLYGADDLRNCSGSSKAEVLENIKMKWSTKTGHRVRVFPVSI